MTTKESDCTISGGIDLQQHWEQAYRTKNTEQLGWYEADAAHSVALIKETGVATSAKILNIGVGSSVLIDQLVAEGYEQVIANDLSGKALEDIEIRLGAASKNVAFIQDDLLEGNRLAALGPVAVWNDRAVLHFFTEKCDWERYFSLLNKVLMPGGYAIIAVFSETGAQKCCGLPVQRYTEELLTERMGSNFSLLKSFETTFINPNGGERPYIYTLFQKKDL